MITSGSHDVFLAGKNWNTNLSESRDLRIGRCSCTVAGFRDVNQGRWLVKRPLARKDLLPIDDGPSSQSFFQSATSLLEKEAGCWKQKTLEWLGSCQTCLMILHTIITSSSPNLLPGAVSPYEVPLRKLLETTALKTTVSDH